MNHQSNIKVEQLQFEHIAAFKAWKEESEYKTLSQYSLKCAPHQYGINNVYYFYCNRAGTYTTKGIEKRQHKSQGTSKLGNQCTSHIKAMENTDTGEVKVEYCATHSHTIKLAHLRIPDKTRMDIAAKLQQGVSMERILDDIRDTVTNQVNREHLIKKKDLRNIKMQYNVDGITRDKNDLTSVSAWVTEMMGQKFNPIILYKAQGQEQLSHMDNTSNDDFLLCIQTEFQRDMFREFGSNVVCIDSTHGTNAYDFKLTTVIVVDEYGEGVPVGWMISNREDAPIIMDF